MAFRGAGRPEVPQGALWTWPGMEPTAQPCTQQRSRTKVRQGAWWTWPGMEPTAQPRKGASRRVVDLAGDGAAAQPYGADHIVGAGNQGDKYRGRHHHGSQPLRNSGQHVKRDR